MAKKLLRGVGKSRASRPRKKVAPKKSRPKYSRKTETGSLRDPVLDRFKREAKWTTKPSGRHGSFPTGWTSKLKLLPVKGKKDPLGQKG